VAKWATGQRNAAPPRKTRRRAPSTARKLVDSGAIVGVELDPDSQEADCDTCTFARATRQPIPKVRISPPAQSFGDEIHTDVWGPATIATGQARRYFITFTDDATQYPVTYLLRTKDEALEAYKSFEAWAIAQQHCKAIKVLRSDRGSEYLSSTFDQHLAKADTARKLTTHDTLQLNSIAERLNRTLMERICRLTHASGLPKSLWGEALRHATWLKNRTVTHALDSKMPYEALYGRPPDLSALRTWSSRVLVHDASGSKLSARAREVCWIGPDADVKAHRVFWPSSGNVTVERNVYFGTTVPLEGEDEEPAGANGEWPVASSAPSTSPSTKLLGMPTLVDAEAGDDSDDTAEEEQPKKPPPPPLCRSERLRKPSRIIAMFNCLGLKLHQVDI
jgi:transposase InsO family protein